jgi:subtilisin family serine protease
MRAAVPAAAVAALFASSFAVTTSLKADAARANPSVPHMFPTVAILDAGVDPHAEKLTASRAFIDVADKTAAGWHGTAVAGAVAAACPRCPIVSAKVLDAQNAGDDAEIARGLLWAVAEGARVVNLSMAGPDESSALRAAIRTATRHGVVVVAAAGNGGTATKTFPAADPNVIGVAATTSSGALFSWSSRGRWVTLAAPGRTTTSISHGRYATFEGTSAAAPAVAAALAECLAVAPRLSPASVRRILTRTSRHIRGMSFGRLDEHRAVAACAAA